MEDRGEGGEGKGEERKGREEKGREERGEGSRHLRRHPWRGREGGQGRQRCKGLQQVAVCVPPSPASWIKPFLVFLLPLVSDAGFLVRAGSRPAGIESSLSLSWLGQH